MNTAANSLGMATSYKEEFMGFEIYVETNPDRWQEGFVWPVCKDGEEIETGMESDIDDAINAAECLIQSNFKSPIC